MNDSTPAVDPIRDAARRYARYLGATRVMEISSRLFGSPYRIERRLRGHGRGLGTAELHAFVEASGMPTAGWYCWVSMR